MSKSTTDVIAYATEEFGELRTMMIDGEPWFVASDIAKALEYASAKDFVRGLEADERGRRIVPTPSGDQEMTVISEAGLYASLMRARTSRVAPFRRWVTHEVLPSIRKRGGYLTPEATEAALSDPDFIIRLATSLKEERARVAALEAAREADAPATALGRSVMVAEGAVSVSEAAKLITQAGVQMGRNRLYDWLRAHDWVFRRTTEPKQWAVDRGLLALSEKTYVRDGVTFLSLTSRVTPKGQGHLITEILSENEKQGVLL